MIKHQPIKFFGTISLSIFFLIFLILFLYLHINILISYFTAINITTFLIYFYDKKISHTDKVRVPEKNLHYLEIFGGTPFAYLAQKTLRHKIMKKSYQIKFWIIFIIQIIVIFIIIKAYYEKI